MQQEQSIIERVNSMDDIFAIGGKTLEEIISPADSKDEAAYKVLKFGVAVLNENGKPDYNDASQVKYEPIFSPESGVGLSYDGYVSWVTYTYCGPRLCYLDLKVLKHGIKIMGAYYHDFYN